MLFFTTKKLLQHRYKLGFAVGFGTMFLQILYLDYKIERKHKSQFKRLDDLTIKVDDLTIKVEDLNYRVIKLTKAI